MGTVKYKFEFDINHIEIPDAIKFGNVPADIANDNKQNGVIEGEVSFVPLDDKGRLAVTVRVRGRNPFTWSLSVTYDGKKTKEHPIIRPIPTNDFYAATGKHELES